MTRFFFSSVEALKEKLQGKYIHKAFVNIYCFISCVYHWFLIWIVFTFLAVRTFKYDNNS